MWIFHKSRAVPFRKAATLTLAMVVIPLFVAVLLFDTYTVRQHRETLRTGRLSTLQVYLAQWEDTIQVLEEFLNVTVAKRHPVCRGDLLQHENRSLHCLSLF